jgi:RNA polymerase sigma factor (sigma-70 family)
MAIRQFSPSFQYVRACASEALTDGELLQRFVERRDEAAFAALVRRHGPLVRGVCRHVLADEHTAEDAFQATFMVLACKAGNVAAPETLAGWLHGVAQRTALKTRASAVRWQRAAPLPELADAKAERDSHDISAAIHEEIGRLPERYRVPVVLCCLQGRTHEQAANQLGWPLGTVATRLAWARRRLRVRLRQRGVAASAAGLAIALKSEAPLPAALVTSTVRAALAFETSSAAGISGAHLAEGVLRTMTGNRLKIALSGALLLGTLGAVAGAVFYPRATANEMAAAQKPTAGASVPAKGKEVAVEVRLIGLSQNTLDRLCQDFNLPGGKKPAEAAIMSDVQLFLVMEAIQGDRRTEIMQCPKLTLDDGQTETLDVSDFQEFMTGVQVASSGGQIVFIPKKERIKLGLDLVVHAVVGADRHSTQIDIDARQTDLVSANVPLLPVTAPRSVDKDDPVEKRVPFTQFIQVPQLNKLRVQQKLSLANGATALVYAGQRAREVESPDGPPILNSIPYVSDLFRRQKLSRETQHVLLAVTARLISAEADRPAAPDNCR